MKIITLCKNEISSKFFITKEFFYNHEVNQNSENNTAHGACNIKAAAYKVLYNCGKYKLVNKDKGFVKKLINYR